MTLPGWQVAVAFAVSPAAVLGSPAADALDAARLPLPARFDGRDFKRVLEGHVLASSTLTRTSSTARSGPAR